ncbi:P-loop containing nucleoside triphosphate hydrolase protein [Lipomyces arxii]|uniref:P-loop containing nucleoside triphosphate hydrolase protein n=1 Tax=Lipomyces arxii TaxID=56418 RepID=UPI0034CF024E
MPSVRRPRRGSTSSPNEDSDDDSASESHSVIKRQRLSNVDSNASSSTEQQTTHAPGAIVRVSLHNFVTYTQAEFFLGPNLNMIIGPNGTGKSTLVCAICLGLGGKSELLGRAKEIGEFVKIGETEGTIEIELQGFPGEQNPVIGRTIHKDNKSGWILNGKQDTFKNAKAVIDRFNVQIDNLCQFLPQDKVAEFAHMSPQQLLIETERATGSAEMLARHTRLIELHAQYTSLSLSKDLNDRELQNLNERQEAAGAEVEQFRERDRIKAEIKLLNQFRPLAEFRDLRAQYETARGELAELRRQLDEAKVQAEPSLLLSETAGREYDKAHAVYGNAIEVYQKQNKKFQHLWKKRDDLINASDEAKSNVNIIKKNYAKHEAKLARLKSDLIRYEEKAAVQPDISRKEEILEMIRLNGETDRANKRKKEEEAALVNQQDQQIVHLRDEIKKCKSELADLESADARKLHQLQKLSKDTYDAVIWLRQNKHRFKAEVYEPPILTLTIDSDKLNMVEAIVSYYATITFTCLSREDYKLFLEEVTDKRGLSVSVSEYSNTDRPNFQDWQRSCSKEKLRQYGLENWLIDSVSGPDPVLNMLAHSCNLDEVAYTTKSLTAQQQQHIEDCKDDRGRMLIKRYIMDGISYYVNKSDYSNSTFLTTRQVFKASRLSDEGVNIEYKNDLNRQIADLELQISMLEADRDVHRKARSVLMQEDSRLGEERRALDKERERMRNELRDQQRAITKRDECLLEIEKYETQPDDSAEQIANMEAVYLETLNEREQFTKKVVEAAAKVSQAERACIVAGIDAFQKRSKKKELKERYELTDSSLVKLENAVKQTKAANRAKKEILEQKKGEAQELVVSLTSEEQAALEALQDTTLEELEAKLSTLNNAYESIFAGNAHVVEQFERRAIEIDRLQDKVDNSEVKILELKSEIDAIRGEWEQELDSLVANISTAFSEAFSSIGCEGNVRVGKDEDYAKWCIEIRVKFRKHEQLQLLTHQRQSGGERSVSTIFYLMSLQDVTKAPFRVVDEINQGMDPRNERVVHSRMVDVACQDHASQYFLITPKLLPHLKYHEKMVVHCIFSGIYLPNSSTDSAKVGLGRLRKYAAIGRRLRGIAA